MQEPSAFRLVGLITTGWFINQTHWTLKFLSIVTSHLSIFGFGITGIFLYQGRFTHAIISFILSYFLDGLSVYVELAHLTKSVREEFDLTLREHSCEKCS